MKTVISMLAAVVMLGAGAPLKAQESQRDAVFTLHMVHKKTMSGPKCLGTLIAPDLLLTAAHCVTVVKIKNNKPVTWGSDAVCVYSQPMSGPCSGDSGGPAFYADNGKVYLAGINTYCEAGVFGVITIVDAGQPPIDSFEDYL